MKRVLQKVFRMLGVPTDSRLPDQTDLMAVQSAAQEMSLNPNYRDTVIVVVELGSEFNAETGAYVRRQYLYYAFHDAADYHRIVCLKAAYRNGRRIDNVSANADSRQSAYRQSTIAPSPVAPLVWGKPGRWKVRNAEERWIVQS